MDALDITASGAGYRFAVDERGRLRQVGFGPGATAEPFAPDVPLGLYPLAYPAFDEEPRRAPALRVTHASGTTSTRLRVQDVETSTSGQGRAELAIHLADEAEPLTVTLHFHADDTHGALTQWVEVTNQQRGAIRLHEVAAASPAFLAGDTWLTQFGGDWAAEWTRVDERLNLGTKVLESRGAIRPHLQCCPYFLLSPAGPSSEDHGLVVAGALGWDGDLRFAFERTVTDQLRVFAGHNHAAGDYILDPGETFRTPSMTWLWSSAGRGPLSRRMHRWVRGAVVRDGDRLRPTVLNNWEATFFDFDEERLVGLMDAGASIGAELFLLDDGWFGPSHPRDDDTAGLGDWEEDPRKLPGGLDALTKAAADRGLRFGLWVEPEMVNPRSALYEAHPDWVIGQPGRRRREERNQLVLDLLRPEVRDHVTGTIERLVAAHPGISYLKWDANRMITEPGSAALAPDRQSNLWVDLPRALTAIARTVAEAHPEVELMLCASGGGRVDVDTLGSFHEVWLSDNTDPVTRVRMQYSASHVLPASVMGAHVTAWGERPVAFACMVAMSGRFGFDLDLVGLAPEDLEVCRRAVDLHRRIRPLVQHGELWRLVDPATTDAAALAFHDPSTGRAVLFAYQLDGPAHPVAVPLPFLDPELDYETATVDLSGPARAGSQPAGRTTLPWPAAGRPITAAVTTFDPALTSP